MNNLAVGIKLVGGGLFFGIPTIIVFLVNSWSIGQGLKIAWNKHLLRLIVFHGFPESIAYILAASVGFKIFVDIFSFFFNFINKKDFSIINFLIILVISTVILFISAIIEAYIGVNLSNII